MRSLANFSQLLVPDALEKYGCLAVVFPTLTEHDLLMTELGVFQPPCLVDLVGIHLQNPALLDLARHAVRGGGTGAEVRSFRSRSIYFSSVRFVRITFRRFFTAPSRNRDRSMNWFGSFGSQ